MTIFRQLSSHLSVPLYRNGYALIANTLATSGLGVLYWMGAARFFSAEMVGVNAAALSAMMLIANLSQLNLAIALNRFVPGAGGWTGRLIGGAYLMAMPLAAAVAIVFLIGQPTWAPALDVLRSSPAASIGFVAATMGWTVFILQDAALVGLRKATWIVPENAAYGLAKIGLLFVFAASAPRLGIFAAATLPLFFLIVPVNVLIYRLAVPHHVKTTPAPSVSINAGVVARFALADFFASLSARVSGNLMPVLVLAIAGAEATAYFFLAWTIAYALILVGGNTGMSLITEAALEPGKLHSLSRRVLLQTAAIVTPAVAVVAIFAPLLLRVFGPEYSREASTVLRLLVLAAIPYVVIALDISMLRVERRMRALAMVQGGLAILEIGLSIILLPILGIAGVGWAWLLSTSLIAVVLLLTDLRFLWPSVVLDGTLGRRLIAIGPGSRATDPLTPTLASGLESIVGDLRQHLDRPGLRMLSNPVGGSEVVVTIVGDSPSHPEAVVKVARTETMSASLRREANALVALHSEPSTADVAQLVPEMIMIGTADDQTFVVQSHVGGIDGRAAELGDHGRSQLLIAAGHAIAGLHHATAQSTVLTDSDMSRLIDGRFKAAQRDTRLKVVRRHRSTLERLWSELRSSIIGQRVQVGWIHGDYWFGNVVVDGSGDLCGIIDWDEMQLAGLPGLDLVHLILTTRAIEQNRELGSIVVAALEDANLSDAEASVMAMLDSPEGSDEVSWRALVLLTWLHHVTSPAHRWSGSAGRWLWRTRNVGEVLEAL